MPDPSAVVVAAVVGLGAAAWVSDRLRTEEAEPDLFTPEGVAEAYARDDISDEELDRYAERAVGPQVRALHRRLQYVENVGDVTAGAIAMRFDSVDEVAGASRDELTAVHGVGESTAIAIKEHLSNCNN